MEKEETCKRYTKKKEEAALARALAREEAQQLKQIRAIEVLATKSSRAVEREANLRLKAQYATEVAASKALRAGKRAKQSMQRPQELGSADMMPIETRQGNQDEGSPFGTQGGPVLPQGQSSTGAADFNFS